VSISPSPPILNRDFRVARAAEIERVRVRYAALGEKACRQATLDVRAEFTLPDVVVRPFGSTAKEAMGKWPGERE